jgi:hypothetical protein
MRPLRALRARLTYANVTATLALVVALSGGAYAATSLPRNSVGSAQIRSGAVGRSELHKDAVRSGSVRNRSLEVKDLSLAARASLRGARGPAGSPGQPGAPAVSYKSAVRAGGDQAAGNATALNHLPGTNEYRVTFGADVSNCVPSATLATVSGSPAPPAGRITVAASGSTVTVRTFDASGAASPQGFGLIVAC